MQVPEHPLGTIGVHHRGGLSDLDEHGRRIHPAVDDPAQHPLGEVRLPELAGREVEPDLELHVELAPCHGLIHELPYDPIADQLDQAEVLGQRDELVGRHHRSVGLDPPDQGLDASHRARVELHDRLVVEGPSLALDGLAESGDELQLGR